MNDLGDIGFLLRLAHFLGAVVAIGAVIATDAVNVFVHLRPRAARSSAHLAPVFSLVVWLGFLVLAVTGFFLVLEIPEVIDEGLFQLKMVLVAIVFVNGVVVNVWVTPRFRRLASEFPEQTPRVQRFVRIAGISAAISLVGWFATVIVSYISAN